MPSRISGACNGCRTKKQKCSGDRDGCIQCAAAEIVCTWPEQRKRGPAKGYIEGLEHRLHEAETLLLQLLPLVSSEQLSTATATAAGVSNLPRQSRDSPDGVSLGRSSPPLLNKKTGIDYWENFPLDTVDNVRRWQQDCALHSHLRDDMPQAIRSRPSSIDIPRDQALPRNNSNRKQSSMQQQYRATSHDSSYSGSNTPHEYNYLPPQSQQQRPNQYTNGSGTQQDTAYMQQYANEIQAQRWQQAHAANMVTMNQHVQPHSMSPEQHMGIVSSGPMEVDGSIFPQNFKRHLFW